MYSLAQALNYIPLSVAYAIWVGIGTALIYVISIVVFNEPVARRALLAAVALAVVLGGAWMWFRDSPLVSVQQVTVSGQSGADAGQIRAALESAARTMSTLDVQLGRLRRAVAPYPVVRDIRVTTHFPHGMNIDVIENVAVGRDRRRRPEGRRRSGRDADARRCGVRVAADDPGECGTGGDACDLRPRGGGDQAAVGGAAGAAAEDQPGDDGRAATGWWPRSAAVRASTSETPPSSCRSGSPPPRCWQTPARPAPCTST